MVSGEASHRTDRHVPGPPTAARPEPPAAGLVGGLSNAAFTARKRELLSSKVPEYLMLPTPDRRATAAFALTVSLLTALLTAVLIALPLGCGRSTAIPLAGPLLGPPSGSGDPASAEFEPLFVLPPQARIAADEEVLCAILVGKELVAPGHAFFEALLDPSSAMCGGSRANEVRARAKGADWFLPVRFTSAGDGIVGFSVRAPAADGAIASRVWTHAKCVVPVVAGSAAGEGAFARRLGLEVEIMPMVDPTVLQVGDELPLRVRSNSGGSGRAELTVWAKRADEAGVARQVFRARTDADGNLSLPLREVAWHLVAVRLEASDATRHSSTLTFHNGGSR